MTRLQQFKLLCKKPRQRVHQSELQTDKRSRYFVEALPFFCSSVAVFFCAWPSFFGVQKRSQLKGQFVRPDLVLIFDSTKNSPQRALFWFRSVKTQIASLSRNEQYISEK